MRNFFVTASLLLTIAHFNYGLPRTAVTEAPNYPRFTDKDYRTFNPKPPAPFTSGVQYNNDRVVQQRALNYAQSPQVLIQNQIPIKQKQVIRVNGKGAPQYGKGDELLRERELEEEEIEEPDRLSQLLPNSKFECNGKNTGYYADEELGCEVFHYCQANAKHSWICPEGFTFHQVHLICMPPGGDNICEKSSQYHFVNDYLYKPVNLEEYQQKPNVSLRYHDRYYPDRRYEETEEQDVHQSIQHRNSVRVPQQDAPTRPENHLGQVFRSPNEVNIPLQQRRPSYLQRYFQQ